MPEPIVLLHGFTQTGAAWQPVRAVLETAGHRVLTPDLRGHGSAAGARPVSLASVHADLDEIVDRRALDETALNGTAVDGAALGGYSMGGRIALAYALARPGRVSRLTLMGASPGLGDPAERRARRQADEALARRLEAGELPAFAREWAAQPLFAGQSPAVAARAHAQRLAQDPGGLAAALRGLGTGVLESLWDRLPMLASPVTLVVGEHDVKFRAIAERMAERLPAARLVVVAGAGHAVHLEAPEAVAAALDP